MNYVRLNKDQIKQHGPYLEALQNCTDKDSLSLRHIIHDKEIECLIATTGKIACIYKIPQELQAVFYGLDFLSYSKGTVMEEAPTGAVLPDYNQILVRFDEQKDWKNLVVITANHKAKWAGLLVSGWELGGTVHEHGRPRQGRIVRRALRKDRLPRQPGAAEKRRRQLPVRCHGHADSGAL